jgi:hypothetical protein
MQIDIGSVLKQSQITHENGSPVSFRLEFIKEDGSVRLITKARRFVKPERAYVNASEKSKSKTLYNLKKNNAILIYDEEAQTHKTIKISRITKFNGITVRH